MKKIVVLFAILLAAFLGCGEDEPDEPDEYKQVETGKVTFTPEPVIKDYEIKIADEEFNLEAGKFMHYQFAVTKGMLNPKLVGRFEENTGYDVEVFLKDDDNYINWRNNKESQSLYFSGRVMMKRFDINLPKADLYHFCISNTYSWFTSKRVNLQATLTYQTWQ